MVQQSHTVKKWLEHQFHKGRDLCPVHCCIHNPRTLSGIVSTQNIFVEEAELEIGCGSVSCVWICCFPLIPRCSQLYSPCLPPLNSEEAVSPSRHPRQLCAAASYFVRLRGMHLDWALERIVERAFIHPGNIHLHTKIWLLWKVRWIQYLLCICRELNMSNSAVFNKILCHSSNRVTIKKWFQWKYPEWPILTKLF